MAIVYIDGTWFPKDQAKISVYDHGLLYGDGLFEGIRIYNRSIFKLQEHLDRLWQGAQAIGLSIPISQKAMADLLQEGIQKEQRSEGYIRLLVTRGIGDLGMNPKLCPRPSIIIIVDDIQLYPREYYQKGIAIITAPTRRLSSAAFDPRIKSLNYLNNIMAKMEAQLAGCLEAVLLNAEGYVTECTGDNIFIISKGIIKTPGTWLGLLEGITRNTIIDLAKDLGLQVQECHLSRFDLFTADECFLTGSGAELIPVTAVDGRSIGQGLPGPVTARITAAFRTLVNS